MTKTVTIAATRTNGDPYAHHDVIVTLVAGSAGGVVGSNVIVSQTKVPLNASGEGSIVLATNDVEITSPATSFYRFTVEGSSPTITRSVRITDALPSTISWTRSGIEVGDPTIPQRDVSSDYVQVGDQSLTNYLADLEAGGGGGSSDAITVPDGTMTFIGAYYPPASAHLTDHLDSIDDAFVGAAQAIVAVGAASIDNDQKGAPNGVAELDGSGLVLSSQLPSYVDDVIVVADYAALPGTGADGKIYVTSDTNLTYRWTGSAYTEISKSLALGTTSSTAHRGDLGSTAYDHSQTTTGNPHGTTAADVGAAATSHSHAASAVTSGTLDIARIPTGATGSTVPFGNDARFNAGPSPAMFPVATGQWFANPHDSVYDQATSLNRVLYVPIWIPSDVTAVDAVEVHVATVGAATAVVRLGLHLPHATTKFPDALVIDAGTLDATVTGGTGARQITFASTALTPNSLAWVSVVSQGAICTLKYANTGMWLLAMGVPSSTGLDVLRATTGNGWFQSSVTGGFGATASPTYAASTTAQPVVALRKA